MNFSFQKSNLLYCNTHYPQDAQNKCWDDLESVQLPNVMISLKLFSEKINDLLNTHLGTLPLLR